MARILVDGTWYDELAPTALFEADYERIFVRHAGAIFPSWTTVPFKCDVVGDDGEKVKPDLALIGRDYKTWWVVEVELAHHSFADHVLPQVRRLATGDYGEYQANFLCRKRPSLARRRVMAMMKG